jgi:hypothetical protein
MLSTLAVLTATVSVAERKVRDKGQVHSFSARGPSEYRAIRRFKGQDGNLHEPCGIDRPACSLRARLLADVR